MTSYTEFYDGQWLRAEHLQGHDARVTIEKVTSTEFKDRNGDPKKQLVLKFIGKDKRLGLNSTNVHQVAKNIGSDEIEDWIGQSITLFPTETQVGGETKPCIRIRPPAQQAKPAQPVRGVVNGPHHVSENPAVGMGDEIPF